MLGSRVCIVRLAYIFFHSANYLLKLGFIPVTQLSSHLTGPSHLNNTISYAMLPYFASSLPTCDDFRVAFSILVLALSSSADHQFLKPSA